MINADDKLKAVFGGKASGQHVRDDEAGEQAPEIARRVFDRDDLDWATVVWTVAFSFCEGPAEAPHDPPRMIIMTRRLIALALCLTGVDDDRSRAGSPAADSREPAERGAEKSHRGIRTRARKTTESPARSCRCCAVREVMNRARAMGDYLRFNSVLPPRLSEFAILITARKWTQNYEWDAAQSACAARRIVGGSSSRRLPTRTTARQDGGRRGGALHLLRRTARGIRASAMRPTRVPLPRSARRASSISSASLATTRCWRWCSTPRALPSRRSHAGVSTPFRS